MPSPTPDAAVHLIQIALTPIFLLSGIAAMLNLLSARLAKVSDRLDVLTGEIGDAAATALHTAEISELHRRSLLLDIAVVLGTTGATATCLAILTLFFLALGEIAASHVLLVFFGGAIVCTLGSVSLFGVEMLLGSNSLRTRMRLHVPLLTAPWRHRAPLP